MHHIPNHLQYTKAHIWIRDEDDGTAMIGITEHAQATLGDLVFVELPPVGKKVAKDSEIGVVESVKAASELYNPLTGEILAVNQALEDAPEMVNDDPYKAGWIYQLRIEDNTEMASLLSADDYQKLTEEDE